MGEPKAEETTKKKRIESKYNAAKLREAIKGGNNAVQIMKILDIKHKQTLKQYVLKLISSDKQFYEIPGLYMNSSSKAKVTKYGTIKLILKNYDLGDFEFKEDDEFSVYSGENRIILEKL